MAERKRTRAQREQGLEQLSALLLEGKPQTVIAELLGVSRSQVGYDAKTLRERWRESALVNVDEMRARELANLNHLQDVYWQAWEDSRKEKATTTSTTEKKVSGDGSQDGAPLRQRAELTKETRDGNPAFLAGIERCIARRCELFGLDAPKKGIEQIDLHHSGSVTLTSQERLDLVIKMRRELAALPEARARVEALFQESSNGSGHDS
jgi:hypothetical protein